MLRRAVEGLSRYIATPYTARHRPFVFLDPRFVPDAMVYVVASADAYVLGILSSTLHHTWCRYAGGTLQDRPRYNSNRTFLPFPFPDTADETIKDRIRESAEKLDSLRKEVLAQNEDLTLTRLYNVLESLRSAEAAVDILSSKDRDVAMRGCVPLIRQCHDTIDAAVSDAYGWPLGLSDNQVLERIIALNQQRAAEEVRGNIKWVRKEFQAPAYVAPAEQARFSLPDTATIPAEVIDWPSALPSQVVAVAGVVERAGRPITARDVARVFKGRRASTVAPVLDALAGMGRVRKLEDGRYAA